MKNRLNLQRITLLLLLITISLSSCIQDFNDLSDTLENDLNLELANDLLQNVAALQFIDNQSRTAPVGLSVEVLTSDYSEVFTFAGFKDLTPTNGLLQLGVRKGAFFNGPDQQIIQLRASAPGFYTSSIYIQTDTAFQDLIVEMVRMNAPGERIQKSAVIPQNNQPFMVDLVNGTQVRFDENTRFFDQQGMQVSGNIAAEVQYYPPSLATKRAFEDILIDSSFIDQNGNRNPIAINPAAMLDVKLSQPNRAISGLSYPAEITLPINQNLFNPLEDRVIQEGDYIPSLFWDETEKAWQVDGFAIVERVNGQLVAALSVRHFTLWVVGWVNASMMSDGTEECQVFVRVTADVNMPIQGSYTDGNGQTVDYRYNQRPEYRFFQVFLNCTSGQGFAFGALREEAKLAARNYFRDVDPTVFGSMKFDEEALVKVFSALNSCSIQSQNSFMLNIDAQNSGSGTLSYNYGNISGSKQIDLSAGSNTINFPIPSGSINTWLFNNANFRFIYSDGNCMNQSSARQVLACELDQGVSLGVNNPVPVPPSMVDFAVTTSCENETEDLIVRPTFPIFFKESCLPNATYKQLTFVRDGVFKGDLPLTFGKMYDFRIQYGNSAVNFDDITIPLTTASYLVDGQTLTLEFLDGVLVFKIDDYRLPDSICSFISG